MQTRTKIKCINYELVQSSPNFVVEVRMEANCDNQCANFTVHVSREGDVYRFSQPSVLSVANVPFLQEEETEKEIEDVAKQAFDELMLTLQHE